MRMVSPDELFAAAKQQMIEGREPATEEDWMRIVNVWGANLEAGTAELATLLLNRIYDCPLSDEAVKEIVNYQLARRS